MIEKSFLFWRIKESNLFTYSIQTATFVFEKKTPNVITIIYEKPRKTSRRKAFED